MVTNNSVILIVTLGALAFTLVSVLAVTYVFTHHLRMLQDFLVVEIHDTYRVSHEAFESRIVHRTVDLIDAHAKMAALEVQQTQLDTAELLAKKIIRVANSLATKTQEAADTATQHFEQTSENIAGVPVATADLVVKGTSGHTNGGG